MTTSDRHEHDSGHQNYEADTYHCTFHDFRDLNDEFLDRSRGDTVPRDVDNIIRS